MSTTKKNNLYKFYIAFKWFYKNKKINGESDTGNKI